MLTAAVACLWMTFSAQNATVSIPLTAPQAPQSSTDVLLRTVLTNLLQKGCRELDPRHGAVIIEKGAANISPRILPPEWKTGFALLPRDEIEALKQPNRYYLSLRVTSPVTATADVTISATPVGGGIALCCWTRVERYERIEDGWRFVRLIGATIH